MAASLRSRYSLTRDRLGGDYGGAPGEVLAPVTRVSGRSTLTEYNGCRGVCRDKTLADLWVACVTGFETPPPYNHSCFS